MNGPTQKIPISSNPTGAHVLVTGGAVDVEATTPCVLELKRKYEYMVVFSMDGYKDQTVELKKGTSAIVGGNVVFLSTLGLGVDSSTGGGNELYPNKIDAVLVPEK